MLSFFLISNLLDEGDNNAIDLCNIITAGG